MSAVEKNIIYMVMAQIKKGDTPDTLYTISAMELMKATGQEIKYDYLKKATFKLISRVLEGVAKNGNLLQVSFVSSAEYITGKGLIEIELSQKILPFYLDLKEQFTTFQLDVALSLNSIYAKRLYEMLSMYKNMKDKRFRVNLRELKDRLYLIEAKTGKEKYEKYTHFVQKVLEPAEREINGQTDIFFTYKAIEGKKYGKGRKPVEQIEFSVIYKEKNMDIGFEGDHMALYGRLTTDFKLRKDQASEVVSKFHREEINRQLYQINIKLLNREIKDVGAYTAKIFKVQ